ncbi:hypothetical protein MFMK1_002110 [Metallumcola ferriviriculae]|uniref:Uncharacterized protein n=1 Tax=Metallumcola ferriviriculae TaxID=3039180 RepID=A0AAU0UMY2_9FIRM|nr:hypothetical protein MFMK1_002110 [Desulfitibacteraceae bacterium MK1]
MLNPELNPEGIFPGDRLVVKHFDPRFDIVILMENTVVEPVPFETESLRDDNLYSRQKIVG